MFLFAVAASASAHTLVRSGDWTLSDSSSGATSTSVATWDSTEFTEQTLDTANITAVITTLEFTTTSLLGSTTSDRPFAKLTLTVVDGEGNPTTYTGTSSFMQGGTAVDNGNGTYTYEFGAISPVSISVYNDEVNFFFSEGASVRSYEIALTLYNSSRYEVSSGYTVDATGRVDVSYVYNGTLVPEPGTATLAFAGLGLLFARRRRA